MSEKRKADQISGGAAEQDSAKRTKIKSQVEFYFSDSNYPRDKFLRAHAALNEEGYIPLETIMTFKRMKELGATVESVAELVKDSSVVQLNSEGTMIKRIAPVPDKDPLKDRSIYASGFPIESTFEEILEFFSKLYPVNSVRILRNKETGESSGGAYIEFANLEDIEKILQQTLKFQEKELSMMKKADYLKKKNEEADGKKKEKEPKENKEERESKPAKEKKKRDRDEYPKGAIMKLDKLSANLTRDTIKETFNKLGRVAFVELISEKNEAYVRFEEPEDATKAFSEFKGPLGDSNPEVKMLEGEEEKEYWMKVRGSGGKKKGGKRFSGRKKN